MRLSAKRLSANFAESHFISTRLTSLLLTKSLARAQRLLYQRKNAESLSAKTTMVTRRGKDEEKNSIKFAKSTCSTATFRSSND